jgi:hypothetical protein
MFERYTERARRVIFFARYEASMYGSMAIATEHLLLGLVRENKNVLAPFVPGGESEIRQDVEKRIVKKRSEGRPKVSTALDLPLSEECKNILQYAADEAEKLGHRHLGTEHLLLGILRESGCLAAQILKENNVELEAVRQKLKEGMAEGASSTEDVVPPDRKTLHSLIDQLPESSLGWVKMMLDRRIADPPRSLSPRSLSMMAYGGRFQRDTEGKMKEGRFTSERHEDGAVVSQTQRFHHGHQISVTEKIRLSDNGKKLLYSQEIVGPNPEQQHKHSMEFDVS